MAAQDLVLDSFWTNRSQVEESESKYQNFQAVQQFGVATSTSGKASSLASEIEKARNQIKQSLNLDTKSAAPSVATGDVMTRIAFLEKENKELRQVTSDLQAAVRKLEEKIQGVTITEKTPAPAQKHVAAPKKQEVEEESDDMDDFFASDNEEEAAEAERVKQERIKQYQEKKSKKPALIAKSNIVLEVKPWDDETDLKEMERLVRTIEMDGLLWGSSKLEAVGYGIQKLVISCVVEDDKVSTDDLEDQITGFEDHVQSMDIAAFNKI